MPRILLVRHGQAAGTFTDEIDPGLSELGWSQARATAEKLVVEMPLLLISSPLQRAQETAQAFAELVDKKVEIEPRVSELPSPGLSLTERGPWIQGVMRGSWVDQDERLKSWRADLLTCLVNQDQDCVIFSHFVAINVATGLAVGAEEVTLFKPNNASITELSNDGGRLSLVRRGDEAETKVN